MILGMDRRAASPTLAARLRAALEGRGDTALALPDRAVSGEALCEGIDAWAEALVRAGVRPGDRVVLASAASPEFIMVLGACLRERLVFCPVDPSCASGESAAIRSCDAKLAIGRSPGMVQPGIDGLPPRSLRAHSSRHGPTPQIAMILRTSGTCGERKHIALSATNLLACIMSHTPALEIEAGSACLSVLPWHHAFGLLIDLLPALVAGATVHREPSGGRNAASIAAMLRRLEGPRCSMVPLQIERLTDSPDGLVALRRLAGGVVGGARVGEQLARVLSTTRLRAGYGLTEASPGVCLGEPGAWRAGMLGRPVGCTVSLSEQNELLVMGPNICVGTWTAAGLRARDGTQPLATGDIVHAENDGTLTFVGRCSHAFKLRNGRFVEAASLEALLRETLHSDAVAVGPGLHADVGIYVEGRSTSGRGTRRAASLISSRLGPSVTVEMITRDALPRTSKGEIDRALLSRASRCESAIP
ncbi:MAG: class I adenylate-forming enzyme family protein [Phycisphaerales bacterium]